MAVPEVAKVLLQQILQQEAPVTVVLALSGLLRAVRITLVVVALVMIEQPQTRLGVSGAAAMAGH
jgi:hypothetical protein